MLNRVGLRFAQERIAREAVEKTGTLDLGRLGLTELPPEVQTLEHLQVLNLGDWYREENGEPRESATFIADNDFSQATLELPFTKLVSLGLGDTNIVTLPSLGSLTNLRFLDCSGTLIHDLEPLRGRTALEELNCTYTQVRLLEPLTELERLRALYCSSTPIDDLKPLRERTTLKVLHCSSTEVRSLEPLTNLRHLRFLDCSITEVDDLEPLRGWTTLKKLICRSTQIRSLEPLTDLTSLRELNCSETLVDDLSPLVSIPELRTLRASACRLASFPVALLEKNPTLKLYLSAVSIPGVPPELLSQGWDDCRQRLAHHYKELKAGAEPLADVKVLVVGNGKAGKTQICNQLRGEKFDDKWDQTHGVQVTEADLAIPGDPVDAKLNLWDFGGQDIYFGTHSLFLRSKSIVLLVWSNDTDNDEEYPLNGVTFRNRRLPFWVDFIRKNVGKNCAVVLVQNKCDEPKDEAVVPPIDGALLKELLPYLQIVHYSAKKKLKHETLNDALRTAIRHVRGNGKIDEIGKRWHAVRRRLQAWLDEDADRIDEEKRHRTVTQVEFRELCREIGCEATSGSLLQYLHNVGIVFHRSELFGGEIILDQGWALNAIYTIFDVRECYQSLRAQSGRFNRSLLNFLIWEKRGFSPQEQELFLSMMVSCGICFELHPADPKNGIEAEYFAPDFLPDRDGISHLLNELWNDGLPRRERVWKFSYPRTEFARSLICKIGNNLSEKAVYWRYGAWFRDPKTRSKAILFHESGPDSAGRLVLQTQEGQDLQLLDSLTDSIAAHLSRMKIDDFTLGGEPWKSVASRREEALLPKSGPLAEPAAALGKSSIKKSQEGEVIDPLPPIQKRTQKEVRELKKLGRWFLPLMNNPDWKFVRLFWYIGYADHDSLMQGTKVKSERQLAEVLKPLFKHEQWNVEIRIDHTYLTDCFEAIDSVFNQPPFTKNLWPSDENPALRIRKHPAEETTAKKSTKPWHWTERARKAWLHLDRFLHDVLNDRHAILMRQKSAGEWVNKKIV